MNADPMKPAPPVTKILRMLRNREKNWTGFARKVSIRLLLCATSVCSVPLWLFFLSNNEPQRHRAHRGCTEKSVYAHFRAKPRLKVNARKALANSKPGLLQRWNKQVEIQTLKS